MLESEQYDVGIIGGGSAGFSAAIAAGREGKSVALIESQDILGGAATINLVNNFCNAYWDGERFIIGGLFQELRHRLIGRKALYQTRGPHNRPKIGQEPFDSAQYADEVELMCRESNVDIFFGTRVVGCTADGTITSLELDNGNEISARAVIDSTGDALIAHKLGVPTQLGRDEDQWVQPLTYYYTIGPVDMEVLREKIPEAVMFDENVKEHWASLGPVEAVHRKVAAAIESGELDLGVTQLTAMCSIPGQPEHMTVNFGHVAIDDPTDEEQLAEATQEGRRQMKDAVEWLKHSIPGFENVSIIDEAKRIGVRQSRQVEGLYKITKEDVINQRQFDDVVAQSCFPIDVHKAGADREWVVIPQGTHYDIPWRTLIPREGPDNLLVAGRCVSADSIAMSTVRMTPSVIALGEAAGITAGMVAETGTSVRDINPDDVQLRLKHRGAILT